MNTGQSNHKTPYISQDEYAERTKVKREKNRKILLENSKSTIEIAQELQGTEPVSCVIEECDRKEKLVAESIHYKIDVEMNNITHIIKYIKTEQSIREYHNGTEINRLLEEMMLLVDRISKLTL